MKLFAAELTGKAGTLRHLLKILVVDDDEMVRFVCSGMLTVMNHEVITASDGHEAVRIVQAEDAGVDVIIMDDNMPQLSGMDTLRRLHYLGIHIPVVICTGRNVTAEDFRISADSVPVAILVKPFTLQQLQASLACVLGH